jgi:ATP adenylyltransferase
MKTLWAPWRMEYILNETKEDGCIFCLKGKENLEERFILYLGEHSLVMMNKYPYINGHLLVAPTRHVPTLDALKAEEILSVMNSVNRSLSILKKTMSPEGFNIGLNLGKVAGAGVENHLHFHLVPRWNGDTNFMTVFGDIRVIPEHLEQTHARLLPLFKKIKEG